MNKQFFVLLFLAIAAWGQQERIAIIQTLDDRDSIGTSELIYLTDRLRETAVNVLPKSRYGVMTTESIVAFLGSQESAEKICRESSCLAELGRKVSADYVAQARIGRFDKNLTIKTELYNSKSGVMVGSFTGSHKIISGLLDIINDKAPDLFKKMPGASGGTGNISPSVAGGIGGVQTGGGDYEFFGGKTYLVNIVTEPEGAVLSFDGVPDSRCVQTPCKIVLAEGKVRIVSALEQYEMADTTVSIKQNNQSINIRLKPNFGVLEIKPAYSDGIGKNDGWNLTLNGKTFSSLVNRLSPGNYEAKLSNECYEDISFKVGINKDKREFFDMAGYIKLKKGGLVLNAEKNGEPISELVYVNGKQIGETPFNGTVPVCAKIEIGTDRKTVDMDIKHKATNTYTYKMDMDTEEMKRKRQAELEPIARMIGKPWLENKQKETEKKETMRDSGWGLGYNAFLGGGVAFNINNIEPTYFKSIGGQWNLFYFELYKRNINFFRFGFNIDFGGTGNDYSDKVSLGYWKLNAFTRLYPVDFLFLSLGAGWNFFDASGMIYHPFVDWETFAGWETVELSISAPVFPVGGGIYIGDFGSRKDLKIGFFIEGLYNIVPHKGAYITINIGTKFVITD